MTNKVSPEEVKANFRFSVPIQVWFSDNKDPGTRRAGSIECLSLSKKIDSEKFKLIYFLINNHTSLFSY